MFKKFMISAILALGVASAASYNVKLIQPSVVKGTELKPGEYRLNVENDKATFVKGKETVEASVKVENADQKYQTTSVRYTAGSTISEIRVGGTKTRLVFNN
ncbi:MAG: hypothetical protein LAQ30_23830 [Acidobacteriia bacterium]|nr:hypothetical protein [Terriglobia bacterium]